MSSETDSFIGAACFVCGVSFMVLGACRAPMEMDRPDTRGSDKALKAVRSHLRDEGRDPRGQDFSAEWNGETWEVLSWESAEVMHYTVSADHRVLASVPGR